MNLEQQEGNIVRHYSRSLIWTVVIAFALGLLATAPAFAQKSPAEFSFDQGKDSPGKVTFNHEKHKEHGAEKCSACHTKIFKMKKGGAGALTMASMKSGKECGACHNGKTELGGKVVFTVDDKANCEKCHKK